MILNYYDTNGRTSSPNIDVELPNLFALVYHGVIQPLYDPKGYQGDLNHLSSDERSSIQSRAKLDYERANDALQLATQGKQKEAIAKWGEIFGSDFPIYTD